MADIDDVRNAEDWCAQLRCPRGGEAFLFTSIREKDIPGNGKTNEAGKGNHKKNVLIDVKGLHIESQKIVLFSILLSR